MSAADVRAVIAAGDRLDPAAGLAFRLAAITGARRSELCAPVYRDLDGDRLTIDSSIAIERTGSVIDRQVPALCRCGDQDREPAGGPSRRAHSCGHRGAASRARALRPVDAAAGERPLNPERLTGWWRIARRDARIETRWRLHDLRHWSATEAIGRGHDIRTVAGRLGHANPTMTLRTYAHAMDGADAGVATTLATALEGDDATS
jgi:integrase